MDLIKEFYKDEPALSIQLEGMVGKSGVKRLFIWFNKILSDRASEVGVEPEVINFLATDEERR